MVTYNMLDNSTLSRISRAMGWVGWLCVWHAKRTGPLCQSQSAHYGKGHCAPLQVGSWLFLLSSSFFLISMLFSSERSTWLKDFLFQFHSALNEDTPQYPEIQQLIAVMHDNLPSSLQATISYDDMLQLYGVLATNTFSISDGKGAGVCVCGVASVRLYCSFSSFTSLLVIITIVALYNYHPHLVMLIQRSVSSCFDGRTQLYQKLFVSHSWRCVVHASHEEHKSWWGNMSPLFSFICLALSSVLTMFRLWLCHMWMSTKQLVNTIQSIWKRTNTCVAHTQKCARRPWSHMDSRVSVQSAPPCLILRVLFLALHATTNVAALFTQPTLGRMWSMPLICQLFPCVRVGPVFSLLLLFFAPTFLQL